MNKGADILFVAGAGTGKTYTLVELFARAVEQADLEHDELVLVTFTEKAAQELQERLLQKFRGSSRILSWLEEHPASTLHAFARKLLGRFPARAGVNPGFDVIQGSAEENLRNRCFETFLAAMAGAPPEDLQILLEVGVEPRQLRHALVELLPYIELAGGGPAQDSDPRTIQAAAARRLREWTAAAAALRNSCDPSEAKKKRNGDFLAAVPGLSELVHELADALEASPLDAVPLISDLTRNCPHLPSNTALKECVSELRMLCQESLEVVEKSLAAPFARLCTDFYHLYRSEKERLALLSFNDMARLACELLEQNEDLRLELVRRIKCIFVDEFQDTDPVLIRMVRLLGYADPSKPRSEGRLVLVGDPRQSIYHFRNADLRVFMEIMGDFHAAGGKTEALDTSRRSAPRILSFTNTLFSAISAEPPPSVEGDETFNIDGVEYDLHPLHPDHTEGGVFLLEAESGEVPSDAPGARHFEAELIASAIRELAGSLRVGYRTGTLRPLEFGDIAVLAPRNDDIQELEEVLTGAGIPCAAEGSRIFLTRLEVKTLSALLCALYQPTDPMSVLSALKSPILNVDDKDILHARLAGWDLSLVSNLPADTGETLVQAVEYVRKFLPLAGQAGPSRLAEALVEEGGLGEFFARLDPTGFRSWGITAALDVVRQEEQSGTDIHTLLQRLSSPDPQTVSPPTPPENTPAVHIMTVHAAKGLQWPCVFPFNLGAGSAGKLRKAHVIAHGPEIEYSISTALPVLCYRDGTKSDSKLRITTTGFAEARERDDAYLSAEWYRKLYVAFTRAEDFLILPLPSIQRHEMKKARGKDKDVQYLVGSIRSAAEKEGVRELRLKPLPEDARTLKKAIRDFRDAPDSPPPAPTMREQPEPSPYETEAVETGTLFHLLMQRFVDSGGNRQKIDEALEDLPRKLRDTLNRYVNSALATGLPEEAVKSGRALTEYPLWTPEGVTRADLLYFSNGAWTVVDYKTDPVSQSIRAPVEKHRAQIQGYANALKRQGYKVNGAFLLLADTGDTFDYLAAR